MSTARRLIYILLFLLVSLPLSAQKQEQKDSLVRLLSAQSGQLIEEFGVSYRKITGPARFMHNGAYLLCDTAIWNVNTNIIKAIGNVKIIHDETVLTGDNLDYIIDEDLAQFRGSVVQLEDKDRNILRTRFLDYNTSDSVAVFQNGGSMKDKDGQVIESRTGTYDQKTNTFTFIDDVNMFSDTTYVKTSRLTYNTDTGLATFTTITDAWNKDNMMTANGGWYDRPKEVFFFRGNVHAMSKDQEAWSDSLYYYRALNDLDVRGHVQAIDTTRNVSALAGQIVYQDSTSTITMTREPAVVLRQVSDEKVDTTWVGADTLIYRSIMMCDVDSLEIAVSKERLSDMESDPVSEYRRQGAETRAKNKAEAEEITELAKLAGMTREAVKEMSAPERETLRKSLSGGSLGEEQDEDQDKPAPSSASKNGPGGPSKAGAALSQASGAPTTQNDIEVEEDEEPKDETEEAITDTLALSDSLSVDTDTLITVAPPKDTTKIGFARGIGRVRVFRSDLQVACDSLAYNDLDSLARLYKNPIIWNDANRQYSADSIAVLIKNQNLDKARLMSDAFVAIQEDSLCYDQIRSAEMMAYFDKDGQLARFDALGGATALFYLEENDVYATVYKVDTKMLSAIFENGDIDRVYNFENVKNEDYPTAQMPKVDRLLKGFSWNKDMCPKGPYDITSYILRPSERTRYEEKPRPTFRQTDIYFPGYMSSIEKKLERSDSLRRVEAAMSKEEEQKDTLSFDQIVDMTQQTDSLSSALHPDDDSLMVQDTTNNVSSVSDSMAVNTVETEVDPKTLKKQQQEEARAAKQAKKDARWAELDAKDAQKAAAKDQKALERKRKKTLRMLEKMDRANAKDQKTLEKYQQKYEKKKARQIKSGKAVIDPIINGEEGQQPEQIPDEVNPVTSPVDSTTLRTA